MQATSDAAFQFIIAAVGIVLAIAGAFCAYVSFLGATGKLKPTDAVGMRLGLYLSRNYKLYVQEKYWYAIYRYAGKIMLPISIVWVLLCSAAVVLPRDPGTRTTYIIAITILVMAALLLCVWHIHHYADGLVSGDKQYIPKA